MCAAPTLGAHRPEEAVRILLVSSDASNRSSLASIIGHSNWSLHEVPTCCEALAFLRIQHVGVVICDCSLPDGDWKTLLDDLAGVKNPPNLIVSSRLADSFLWSEVLNLGGYDVLAAPFEASEVFRVVSLAWLKWKDDRERSLRRSGSLT